MVSFEQAKMYSEVYQILEELGDEYKNLIPEKLYKLIKTNRLKNYDPKISFNTPLTEQDINKQTTAFLCMLHYNYWCKDETERNVIDEILEHNENEKREKYFKYQENFDTKKINNKMRMPKNNSDCNALIIEENKNWINKMVNRLKRLFGKFHN